MNILDSGPRPLVTGIENLTLENTNFRTTLWTGPNLQITLMSINPGEEIGLEVHDTHDQFLRIEAGEATVKMGPDENTLETWTVVDGDAIVVPAGTWHNLINKGSEAVKIYSIYSPAEHPHGTIHITKKEADLAEADEHKF